MSTIKVLWYYITQMVKINIKPMSMNRAYKGRVYKSGEYLMYEKELGLILPRLEVPEGPLALHIKFGFSRKASDIDNPVKPFLDVLQKKYGFNDKMVYELKVEKRIVPVGKEFIEWRLSPIVA